MLRCSIDAPERKMACLARVPIREKFWLQGPASLHQEKMGYVVQKMVNGSLASHAFFALAGCARPTDYSDRGCSEERTTRAHISVEGWTAGAVGGR